jgi:hypothetical protein
MNEEYQILQIQFWKANVRKDYQTADKIAKILSEYNRKNIELKTLFNTLFGDCN